MERLTDRARAAALKDIITRMEAGGFEVAEENKIYVALAEHENNIEDALFISHDKYNTVELNCIVIGSKNGNHGLKEEDTK